MSKRTARERRRAEKIALDLIDQLNCVLQGEVYVIVDEAFGDEKEIGMGPIILGFEQAKKQWDLLMLQWEGVSS